MSTQPTITRFVDLITSGEANAFLFHGNIGDLTSYNPRRRLIASLLEVLAPFQIIVRYQRANGLTFALPAHEKLARQLLKLDNKGPAAGQTANPLAALGGPTPSAEWPRSPWGALSLVDELLQAVDTREQPGVAVIVEYAEFIAPDAQLSFLQAEDRNLLVLLQEWGQSDRRINGDGNVVILLCNELEALHQSIRNARYKAIQVPKPGYDRRLEFIQACPKPSGDVDDTTLARLTAGLTLNGIEDLLLRAQALGTLTPATVKAIKDEMIASEYAGLVQVIDPSYGFEAVGGWEHIKTWMMEYVIQPFREGRIDDMAKAIIFAGPPGTGKTFFTTALARELGFNALNVKASSILSKWQGESERNWRRLLDLAESLAPVLFFADELDQSPVSQRGQSNGNPAAATMFNDLLQWLGRPDLRGQVLFVAGTNRPDLLDDALLRNGRTDAVIPVLLPTATERAGILTAQVQLQRTAIAGEAHAYLVASTDRYSAADLEALVRKARLRTRNANRTEIGLEEARRVVATLRPNSISKAEWYEKITIAACNDTDLLPPDLAQLLDDRSALDEAIATIQPDGGSRRGIRL